MDGLEKPSDRTVWGEYAVYAMTLTGKYDFQSPSYFNFLLNGLT